ncbi:MAG: hypothetical protein VW338_00835 [Rhodospirillaceae bacterium]
MAHIRQQVRAAVAAALDGLPTTQGRVFTARPFPLSTGELPGFVVFIVGETNDVSSASGGSVKLDRLMELVLVGYAEGLGVEDTLDAMAAEAEARIAESFPIGGGNAPIQQILIARTEIAVDGDARTRAGEIRMTFEVRTRTTAADPETAV